VEPHGRSTRHLFCADSRIAQHYTNARRVDEIRLAILFSFQHKESLVGALPKKKVSNHRQGNRRQHHRVKLPQLKVCPQCRQARLSHHACPNCGTYRGRQVLPVKTARAAE
jgi:large subunit ribosomal protein L32